MKSRSELCCAYCVGYTQVHLRISSPPVTDPCFYGMDFPSKEELFANQVHVLVRTPSSTCSGEQVRHAMRPRCHACSAREASKMGTRPERARHAMRRGQDAKMVSGTKPRGLGDQGASAAP